MQRRMALSNQVLKVSQDFLASRGLSYDKPDGRKKIAASVLKLSDFFINSPRSVTPWDESWAQEAYFGYYLPLNEIRNRAVVQEGLRVGFFEGLTQVIDFGAGPGTASFALESLVPQLSGFQLIERSKVPAEILAQKNWRYHLQLKKDFLSKPQQTLFVASYSLTEATLPPEALSCEALMILEPSTREDGRELLKLRQTLIDAGYSVWAPCTHQLSCPLLEQSPRDWCHDRVHVDRPDWWAALEDNLPFRNQTITFSYLLARKERAPKVQPGLARVVGDSLKEKGKTRQLICRGPEREFAAWLHRQGEPPEWPRGILVEIPSDSPKVGQEIRIRF